jgi:hypothetical protein
LSGNLKTINDDFNFIDSLKDEEEDCEKPVQLTSRDLRHDKFRNQANEFENYDFLKDFQKKIEQKVKNLIKIWCVSRKKKT